MKNKIEELVLAKCIKNIDPMSSLDTGLEIGKYYVVSNINMGQSYTSITINDKSFNSVLFEFYDDTLNEIDIYSKYNPYRSVNNENSKD